MEGRRLAFCRDSEALPVQQKLSVGQQENPVQRSSQQQVAQRPVVHLEAFLGKKQNLDLQRRLFSALRGMRLEL